MKTMPQINCTYTFEDFDAYHEPMSEGEIKVFGDHLVELIIKQLKEARIKSRETGYTVELRDFSFKPY